MILIKKVGEAAIPAIQELAEVTWPVAYGAILPEAQLQYMLQLFYSNNALREQMHKGHQFILATENEEAIAFASYSPKINEQDQPTATWRLHKIYIHPSQQGKGIGKLLIDFIREDILPAGATALELNVNRSNKAIGFYQKLGFVIKYEEDIPIGNGYFMNDYVMELPLSL